MEAHDSKTHQESGGTVDMASMGSSVEPAQTQASISSQVGIKVGQAVQQASRPTTAMHPPFKEDKNSQAVAGSQKSGVWTTIPSITTLTTSSSQIKPALPEVTSTSHQDSDLIARLSSPTLSSSSSSAQPLLSVLPDSGHNYAMAVTTSASPSGSTIHHLSQTSPRQLPSQSNKVASIAIGGANSKTVSTSTSVIDSSSMVSNIGYIRPNTNTSPISSPKSKRIKLEEKMIPPEEVASVRKSILEYKLKHFLRNKENYREHACELFFLQNGGNMLDYFAWKKRPTPQLLAFLRDNKVDSDEDDDQPLNHPEVKVPAMGGTPVAVSTTLPAAVTLLTQGSSPIPGRPMGGRHGMVFGHHQPTTNQSLQPLVPGGTPLVPVSSSSSSIVSASPTSVPSQVCRFPSSSEIKLSSTPKSSASPSKSPKLFPPGSTTVPQLSKALAKQQSLSTAYDSSLGSQEQIVERAKQEAYVMQRVAELRKEGLWSTKRLPKVQEPPRVKAHWDYLLEEMVWLATDFAQERKWKKAAAKKCAKMVMKHLQEQKLKEERAEKEEGLKLRRIASFIAKEVKQFWSNIEKVAEYKQQSILDEKRKKALDIHLNFIVDQTEKYSSWLTQGLSQSLTANNSRSNTDEPASALTSTCQSPSSSPTTTTTTMQSSAVSDEEFNPESETDDEETISKAEISEDKNEQNEELEMLQKESELPIEDVLKRLPQEILDKPASIHSDSSDHENDEGNLEKITDKEANDDNEYKADIDSTDDEATLDEQETKEQDVDHAQEIDDLEAEGNMSIDELYKKYAAAYDSDFEVPSSDKGLDSDDDSDDGENASDEESVDDTEASDEESTVVDVAQDMGVEFLVNPEENSSKSSAAPEKSDGPSKEISDIAATAESFQPKGYTLSTAQVCTKVPFLLKHQLREYQHIGLDWLVAMNDKKLNGILADEMGLGKTIQTIALLAHLACEKGNWGPHLIVVPTSVMLNWEMELKKWCPAFKILTYYGSVKERKKKREGWTKPNTFHVCITSYKLVVQDHQSFRRKKWKYLILDEAQNIKNFKSQRWQYLLNLVTTRRLLLTGTPLQNSLMELWSLMHFLMPNVFSSHKEFKEWFANPMSDMIEGSHEYNDSLIKRLHKVLRPFLLRRLKSEVEKQLPSKYEHVIMCRLSKRQRFLYDDFMSRTKTKETLESGNFLSVINVLMQLRKVCNHPNMFEERPIVSPFQMEGIDYNTASVVLRALEYDPLKHINLWTLNLLLTNLELTLTAFAAHRIRKFQMSQKLIEEIDSQPDPPPKCPPGKIRLHIRSTQPGSNTGRLSPHPSVLQPLKAASSSSIGIRSPLSSNLQFPNHNIKNAISQAAAGMSATPMTLNSSSGPITVQIQQTQQGPRLTLPAGQITQLPGFAQLVQTSSGQHILLTTSQTAAQLLQQAQAQIQQQVPTSQTTQNQVTTSVYTPAPTKPLTHASSSSSSLITNSTTSSLTTSTVKSVNLAAKPVVKVAPFNVVPTTATPAPPVIEEKPSIVESDKPTTRSARKECFDSDTKSLFDVSALKEKRSCIRNDCLSMLGRINKRRCEACPLYGSDLIQAVNIRQDTNPIRESTGKAWKGMGHIHCLNAPRSEIDCRRYRNYTSALCDIVNTPEMLLKSLKSIVDKYVFLVPPARAPSIRMHVSHPPPSDFWNQKKRTRDLEESLGPKTAFLHPISSLMHTQFPDRRLLQYDCGKLQIMDRLLRQLKSGQHRVLIFTQMTRMLDILEAFLNIHGHIYLRLDGATRVEQRQALMERFNADKRIFVFILSTRSGGIGVNLTGADTVIFYDSDWNPTMDAQAQDRCHRIGQTRDVHIYRLISEKTIEENILKKANQKRLLGNIAIEGGNFTTAFFKENALQDLFGGKAKKVEVKRIEPKSSNDDKVSQIMLEQALCQAEEESDVTAAKTAKAEAAAELEEFDESIPLDADGRPEEPSQAEEEIGQLMEQLKPVERYALNFLESVQEPLSLELLKQAEEEIEAQKNNWELGRLQALKEEEERRAELEEESLPYYTYSREEAQTQVYISKINNEEEMPIWCPPTPPQDDNDLYIDYSLAFMYDHSVMSETDLPPVYVRRDIRKVRVDPSGITRRQKSRKEEAVHVPRSLFDRPTAALLKMRREAKLQKVKGIFRPHNIKPPGLMINKPLPESVNDGPEWLVHEDWALLQTIQSLQELPLALTVLSPAQTPNWDLVSDLVNGISRIYRSPKQCKLHYEAVLVPREEGRVVYDPSSKKQKTKTKSLYKAKSNRSMRTGQLFVHDNNAQFSSLYYSRYEVIKSVTSKRAPTLKPLLANPTMKNPKHAAVLAESGIAYEQPLNPVKVAAIRAERIAREKQKSQQAAAAVADQQIATQRPQTILPPQVIPKPVVTVASIPGAIVTKPITAASVVAATTSVVVSTSTTVASPSYSAATIAKGLVVTHQSPLTPLTSVRTASPTTASIQDQVVHTVRAITNAANSLTATGTTQSATVVSVANLTPAQVQAAAQRITANLNVITSTGVVGQQTNPVVTTTTTKTLTPAQLQLFRQTALIRHQRLQQEQQIKQQQLKRLQVTQVQQAGATALQPARISVAVSSPITTTTGTVQVQVAAQIAQQRLAQQMVAKQQQIVGMAGKQTITRTMTEAEMTQLLKRQQLQQKTTGAVGPVTLSTAQLLAAQAQLQQTNTSSNLQLSQQTPTVATLVKTVSAPGALGSGSSVTIPVSAVNVKVAGGTGKVATVTQQQQLRQLQIQQQLIQQQRKLQLQQQQQKVVSSLAQVTKMGGKTPIPTQLSAVQIVQGQPGALTQATAGTQQVVSAPQAAASKQLPSTTVTMQQIHQVIKQVQQQHQQAQAAQASSGAFVPVTSHVSNPTIAVVSSSQVPHQVMQQAILAKPISQTSTASLQNVVPVVTSGATQLQARVIPSISSSGVAKQTIQLLTNVHTIRPQAASVISSKIITTQGLANQTAIVKTIPSILQSVVTTSTSIVKPIESVPKTSTEVVATTTANTLQTSSLLQSSSTFIPVVPNSIESTPPTTTSSTDKDKIATTFTSEEAVTDTLMEVDESSILDDDSGDNSNSGKDSSTTRASPYPMRVRNPPKL